MAAPRRLRSGRVSDLDLAIRTSKRLERRLRDGFNATGKGLHTLVDSVEHKLPRDLVKKLRLVATVRNKLVHDLDYTKIDDRARFERAAKEAERELERLAGPAVRDSWRLTLLALVLMRRRGVPLEWNLW